MDWDDMKLFLAVAQSGSVSGAGRKLGVQHSTVSRRLRALEKTLGVRLVERIHGGFELTEAGKKLQASSESVEREVDQVERLLKGQDRHLAGSLRVTVVNHIAHSLLMPVFARFIRQYPQIELQIQSQNSYISLPQREADIALRVIKEPTETLVGKKLVSFASAAYGSREYLAHLEATGGEPRWLGTECCRFHHGWTQEVCPDENFPAILDETGLVHAAVQEGIGLSFLPCFIGDRDDRLQRFGKLNPEHNLDLWILFHSELKNTARIQVFREFIQTEIEKQRRLLEGLQSV